MTLRAAREEDAEPLALLHERCWTISYAGIADAVRITDRPFEERVEMWRGFCRGEGLPMWIAEHEGEPVGFVAFGPSRDEDGAGTGEVVAIYVDPAAQHGGHGSALLARAEEALREEGLTRATLWTLRDNAPARGFYAARGWRPDGAEKTDEGLDHVRYGREL